MRDKTRSPGKAPIATEQMADVVRLTRDLGASVHGLHTAFRSWAADNGWLREAAEAQLAHIIPSAVGR